MVGESDLDYERVFPDSCFGDFIPTEYGEKLMPIVTGVSRALLELSRTRDKWQDLPLPNRRDVMRSTTEYGDTKAAEDQFEALELELRGPNGAVIPTSCIGIQDTEWLLQWSEDRPNEIDADGIAEQLSAEELSEIEADTAEEWFEELEDFDHDREPWETGDWKERPFPRYQIHVELIDEWSIP